MINWKNKILGRNINTRSMRIETPPTYVHDTAKLICTRWHSARQHFFISDIETLAGRLGHISETAPWLRFLMSHIYSSLTHSLGVACGHLISTRKDFRDMLKFIKKGTSNLPEDATPKQKQLARHVTFAQSQTAKAIHHSKQPMSFNNTLRIELRLIQRLLSSAWVDMSQPLGHMVG